MKENHLKRGATLIDPTLQPEPARPQRGWHVCLCPHPPWHLCLATHIGGSNSYWPSHAVTAFNVAREPATHTPQPTQPESLANQNILPGIIGIIAAIAIGFAVTILVLKKKP